MTFINWFDTFTAEKKIPYIAWEINSEDGTTHMIDNNVVMEHIRIASESEQNGIKNVLVKIDFANGDVNHFFKHLATALVNKH